MREDLQAKYVLWDNVQCPVVRTTFTGVTEGTELVPALAGYKILVLALAASQNASGGSFGLKDGDGTTVWNKMLWSTSAAAFLTVFSYNRAGWAITPTANKSLLAKADTATFNGVLLYAYVPG